MRPAATIAFAALAPLAAAIAPPLLKQSVQEFGSAAEAEAFLFGMGAFQPTCSVAVSSFADWIPAQCDAPPKVALVQTHVCWGEPQEGVDYAFELQVPPAGGVMAVTWDGHLAWHGPKQQGDLTWAGDDAAPTATLVRSVPAGRHQLRLYTWLDLSATSEAKAAVLQQGQGFGLTFTRGGGAPAPVTKEALSVAALAPPTPGPADQHPAVDANVDTDDDQFDQPASPPLPGAPSEEADAEALALHLQALRLLNDVLTLAAAEGLVDLDVARKHLAEARQAGWVLDDVHGLLRQLGLLPADADAADTDADTDAATATTTDAATDAETSTADEKEEQEGPLGCCRKSLAGAPGTPAKSYFIERLTPADCSCGQGSLGCPSFTHYPALSCEEVKEAAREESSSDASDADAAAAKPGLEPLGGDDLEQIRQQLRDMVEAGELTPEEARRKLQAMRDAVGGGAQDVAGEGLDEMKRRLREMVERGELTEEQAQEKMEAMRGQHGRHHGDEGGKHMDEAKYQQMRQELADKVAQGLMTPQEAKDKLAAFKERHAHHKGGQGGEGKDMDEMKRMLQEMVEQGRLTPEEAEMKLAAMAGEGDWASMSGADWSHKSQMYLRLWQNDFGPEGAPAGARSLIRHVNRAEHQARRVDSFDMFKVRGRDTGFAAQFKFFVSKPCLYEFQFGMDASLGGAVLLQTPGSDEPRLVSHHQGDMWWQHDWANHHARGLDFTAKLLVPGWHVITVYGAKGAGPCRGQMSFRLKAKHMDWTPVTSATDVGKPVSALGSWLAISDEVSISGAADSSSSSGGSSSLLSSSAAPAVAAVAVSLACLGLTACVVVACCCLKGRKGPRRTYAGALSPQSATEFTFVGTDKPAYPISMPKLEDGEKTPPELPPVVMARQAPEHSDEEAPTPVEGQVVPQDAPAAVLHNAAEVN